jgi:hypothetical protein
VTRAPRRDASLLVLFRVVLSVGVAIALPFSNLQWGASYPGGGPDANIRGIDGPLHGHGN